MNHSIFRFTLNMHNHRSQASVSAFRGDTGVRLLISLTDGGNLYFIEDGCTAILSGTKPDGNKLCNRCVIEKNTMIQYDFTEQTATCIGVTNCEITLYGADGKIITAPKFVIVVDEREFSGDDLIESETERDALDAIFLSEAQRIEAERLRDEAENGIKDENGNIVVKGRVQVEQDRVIAEEERAEAVAKATEDATTAAEVATSAMEVATTASESVSNFTRTVSRNTKRITNLEQGISPDPFETDSSVAYIKTVPSNACPYAQINGFGGKSYKSKNLYYGERNLVLDGTTKSIDLWVGNIAETVTLSFKTAMEYTNPNGPTTIRATEADGTVKAITPYVKKYVFAGLTKLQLVNWGNEIGVFQDMQLEYGSTATEYEPYFEGIRDSKVTSIVSKCADDTNLFKPIDDYQFEAIPFIVGHTYKVYTNAYDIIDSLVFFDKDSLYDTQIPITSEVTTFTVSAEYSYGFNIWGSFNGNFMNPDYFFILTDETPTKVIDTIEIPEEIQIREGYGADGFYVDFEQAGLPDFIEVEGGGSIEFVNEYENAVPSSITYQLKGGTI